VVILTSNLGAQYVVDAMDDADREDEVRLRVLDALREKYRPEFLNRLDEFVIFKALGRAQLDQIIRLQLAALSQRLAARRITIDVSQSAVDVLGDLGYNPEFGARPLKRVVQQQVESPLARGLLGGEFTDGDTISIEVDSDTAQLHMRVTAQEAGSRTAQPHGEGDGDEAIDTLAEAPPPV